MSSCHGTRQLNSATEFWERTTGINDDDITHDTCGFFVGLVPIVAKLVHGKKHPAMHRFQTIADIRQRATHYHAHGIVQIGLPHLIFQINWNRFLSEFFCHCFVYRRLDKMSGSVNYCVIRLISHKAALCDNRQYMNIASGASVTAVNSPNYRNSGGRPLSVRPSCRGVAISWLF